MIGLFPHLRTHYKRGFISESGEDGRVVAPSTRVAAGDGDYVSNYSSETG